MTTDPHTTNSAPRTALSASLAASTPLAGVSRRRDPLNGPQTGAQRLGRPWHALSRRWAAWEWAALTCPHRRHLRRYRWSLAAYAVVRVGPAWIVHSLRHRSST